MKGGEIFKISLRNDKVLVFAPAETCLGRFFCRTVKLVFSTLRASYDGQDIAESEIVIIVNKEQNLTRISAILEPGYTPILVT